MKHLNWVLVSFNIDLDKKLYDKTITMYYSLKTGFITDAFYLKAMKVVEINSKSHDHLKVRCSLPGR